MAAPAISIRNLDHLGLVAALCQELGIARMIEHVLAGGGVLHQRLLESGGRFRLIVSRLATRVLTAEIPNIGLRTITM